MTAEQQASHSPWLETKVAFGWETDGYTFEWADGERTTLSFALLRAAPDLLAAAESLEWTGQDGTCPECGASKEAWANTHWVGCTLGNALARAYGKDQG